MVIKKSVYLVLTNICVYWFTQTIGPSMRVYCESAHVWSPNANTRLQVPTGFLMLQKDIAVAPREWENRFYSIVIPAGGHFVQ